MNPGTWALLRTFSWQELRHHAWRHGTAVVAVMLGVALAFAVHLINASALGEFSSAVRAINGEPDVELRAQRDGFDETLYARVAAHPRVAHASPVVEAATYALGPDGQRVALRIVGLDALVAGPVSPALVPSLHEQAERTALFDPGGIALNPAARRALGLADGGDDTLRSIQVQHGISLHTLTVHGDISAAGAPLGMMDIAGAQALFDRLGRLDRIDLQFVIGADPDAVLADLDLPPQVRAVAPGDAVERISNVSRAYRVNLTVLALVALFTGGFLVFSIVSLSVAKRLPQFALLGVLGLDARERLRLVLAESVVIGVLGSALGIALGTALAHLALAQLAGDLGGGYFPGIAPGLRFSWPAAFGYGALGLAAALAGAWVPARTARGLAPAVAIKGLGDTAQAAALPWLGPLLLVLGGGLALLPPVAGLPLPAYAAVACLLVGGIACVPAGVHALLAWAPPPRDALSMLAIERARRVRHSATIAMAGVVASLSLAVALTVMVASFRDSVSHWLDQVLPADLYARTAVGSGTSEAAFLPPDLVRATAALPGVERVETLRLAMMTLDPARPDVTLIARTLDDPARTLPLVGGLREPSPDTVPVYVSEAMVTLYDTRVGRTLRLPLPGAGEVEVFVRGVWRDYARQHGAVVIDERDFHRLGGDRRVNDLALWLSDATPTSQVQAAIRALAADPALVEFAEPRQIRAVSLRIFDRSFAVTYWLQAVAIGIGLFGVAASFSAQVLARRKEFGLLAHLGLTRRQILALVAAEGALWTAAGALVGLLLGIAVSVVLVHVVNPQSFHWTMDLLLPWWRLAALCVGVMAAGTLTAWAAGRQAVTRDAVLAVKEDW